MRTFTKRTALLAAGAAVVVASGGVAYAYWTNSGSGTGSAATGSNSPITVVQTSTVSGLAPGLPAQSLSGTFDNGNASPVYVHSVTVTVDGTDKAGCDASNYAVVQPALVDAEVQPGAAQGSWAGGSIVFVNKATNQDACKSATVHLSYSSD
jgi:hypothetical protein